MTIDDLAAAVARLRNAPRQYVIDGSPDMSAVQSNDVLLIISALEAAQQDARRYRWLRDQMWSQAFTNLYTIPVAFADTADKAGEGIDAAIDAAMGDSDA